MERPSNDSFLIEPIVDLDLRFASPPLVRRLTFSLTLSWSDFLLALVFHCLFFVFSFFLVNTDEVEIFGAKKGKKKKKEERAQEQLGSRVLRRVKKNNILMHFFF